MAGISLDSVSNLSPELQKAFQAAVQAERKPIQTLTERKGNVEGKAKLLNDLLGKVENVQKLLPQLATPIALRELATSSADEHVVTAVADKQYALPGKHSLEVLQLAEPSRAVSNGFEDKDQTRIGPGYFSFTTAAGEEKEVFVDEENSTLEGLARTINRANLGLRASVVNDRSDDDAPFRLVMTSDKSGTGQDIEYPDFYFLGGDFQIEDQQPSSNAVLRYEGIELETPSNEVKDLIPGVTLSLRGVSEPGRPVTVSIEQDTPKTKAKVKDLVDNLNGVFSFIQGQNKMDKDTPPDKTLGGDYGIRLTESRLRTSLQQEFREDDPETLRSLGQIGIQFNRNGILNVDEKKLETAIADNYDDVADLLIGDGVTGVVPRLKRALDTIAGSPSALLTSQKKTFSDRISRMQKDIDTKEASAEKKTAALRDRLAKMQGAISALQSQSGFLAAQAAGGGGGFPSQLLG